MNEIPQRIDRHLTPDQTARAEDQADKRGISIDMAERAILGIKIDEDTMIATVRPARKSRRIGHVRNYESDRDHDQAEARAAYEPASPDQPEVNARGRALVEAALDEAFGKDRHIKAITEKVHRDIPIDPDNVAKSEVARELEINALLRKYFDQKDNI